MVSHSASNGSNDRTLKKLFIAIALAYPAWGSARYLFGPETEAEMKAAEEKKMALWQQRESVRHHEVYCIGKIVRNQSYKSFDNGLPQFVDDPQCSVDAVIREWRHGYVEKQVVEDFSHISSTIYGSLDLSRVISIPLDVMDYVSYNSEKNIHYQRAQKPDFLIFVGMNNGGFLALNARQVKDANKGCIFLQYDSAFVGSAYQRDDFYYFEVYEQYPLIEFVTPSPAPFTLLAKPSTSTIEL